MGYTHYWEQDPTATEAFGRTALDVKVILDWAKDNDIKIAGGMGTGAPELTEARIWINGLKPDAFETFGLSASDDGSFNFCKTGERPYDIVVGLILLRAAHHGLLTRLDSDGDWDGEWKPIREVYVTLFGDEPKNFQDEG